MSCSDGRVFSDTRRLLERAAPGVRELWGRVRITYSTEKVVHYGGTFTSPLLAKHPVRREPVLRYAEPVEDLNPVRLEIEGIPDAACAEFLFEMRRRLLDPEVCYAHRWRAGDILVADNHALLHGRRAFVESAPRHILFGPMLFVGLLVDSYPPPTLLMLAAS